MALGAFLEGNTVVLFSKEKLKLGAQQQRRGVLEFTLVAAQVSETLPAVLGLAYGAMDRNASATRTDVDLTADGMMVELRLYPEQVKPELSLPGAELKRFKLKRDAKDADKKILLSFQTEAVLDKESGAFVVHHFGDQVWMKATEQQPSLPLAASTTKAGAKDKSAAKPN